MVRIHRRIVLALGLMAVIAATVTPAFAQDGTLLTTVQNDVVNAAQGWQSTVTNAAESLFWILATIEIGIAAAWLALSAASLDAWFAELVRRIMFIGFFLFVLEQGPSFAKAIVDSLFQLGANGGSASPADVFNAGLSVAAALSAKAQFGLFSDNALAIAAVFAMVIVVVSFSLVAAIFVAVMVEMYIGLLAGMKLMALVMIAHIGSQVLINLANEPSGSDQFLSTLAIAGISVVVFIISIYVPNIIQGVVQGASVTGGAEVIRHGAQTASFAAGGAALGWGGARAGGGAFSDARASGSSFGAAALKGMGHAIGATGSAVASAARDKAIRVPGSWGASTMGLANTKLDQAEQNRSRPKRQDSK